MSNIYKVPLLLRSQGVLEMIQDHFKLPPPKEVPSVTSGKTKTFNIINWTQLSNLYVVTNRAMCT